MAPLTSKNVSYSRSDLRSPAASVPAYVAAYQDHVPTEVVFLIHCKEPPSHGKEIDPSLVALCDFFFQTATNSFACRSNRKTPIISFTAFSSGLMPAFPPLFSLFLNFPLFSAFCRFWSAISALAHPFPFFFLRLGRPLSALAWILMPFFCPCLRIIVFRTFSVLGCRRIIGPGQAGVLWSAKKKKVSVRSSTDTQRVLVVDLTAVLCTRCDASGHFGGWIGGKWARPGAAVQCYPSVKGAVVALSVPVT